VAKREEKEHMGRSASALRKPSMMEYNLVNSLIGGLLNFMLSVIDLGEKEIGD